MLIRPKLEHLLFFPDNVSPPVFSIFTIALNYFVTEAISWRGENVLSFFLNPREQEPTFLLTFQLFFLLGTDRLPAHGHSESRADPIGITLFHDSLSLLILCLECLQILFLPQYHSIFNVQSKYHLPMETSCCFFTSRIIHFYPWVPGTPLIYLFL